MKKISILLLVLLLLSFWANTQRYPFNGLDMDTGNLSRLSSAQGRSTSPENLTGEKGKGTMADLVRDRDIWNKANAASLAEDLGKGWEVNPFIIMKPGEAVTITEVDGPGTIQQIWMIPASSWRFSILRTCWDDEKEFSVGYPVRSFFVNASNEYTQLSSLTVCVNPGNTFNCYWKVPSRKRARITLGSINDVEETRLCCRINYTLTEMPEDEGCFYAQFRRSDPTQGPSRALVDGIRGRGQCAGTHLAWRVNDNCRWGEGEIKFYIDGDKEYPTTCEIDTGGYFCGSYNFENQKTHQHQEFITPYVGIHQVIRPDGLYRAVMVFGLYHWHILDPVCFEKGLKVMI